MKDTMSKTSRLSSMPNVFNNSRQSHPMLFHDKLSENKDLSNVTGF
jgi:hypothetical protein